MTSKTHYLKRNYYLSKITNKKLTFFEFVFKILSSIITDKKVKVPLKRNNFKTPLVIIIS